MNGQFVNSFRSEIKHREEGKDANEVNQSGQFAVDINLGGGNTNTDTLFPSNKNGALEVKFQNQDARVLTATETKKPASAPAGFVVLELVSYIVVLDVGATSLIILKIDYIRNANTTLDIRKGILGLLC